MKENKPIYLHKYNKITGYWKIERECTFETYKQWLEIFQKDSPEDTFVVSHYKNIN